MLAPDLVPGNPATGSFSLSTLVLPVATAIAVGEFDEKAEAAVALWLDRSRGGGVAARPDRDGRSGGAPAGRPGARRRLSQLRLRPVDLYRELVALHAQKAALDRRVQDLEQRLAERSAAP